MPGIYPQGRLGGCGMSRILVGDNLSFQEFSWPPLDNILVGSTKSTTQHSLSGCSENKICA
jgi:hypothetical protein